MSIEHFCCVYSTKENYSFDIGITKNSLDIKSAETLKVYERSTQSNESTKNYEIRITRLRKGFKIPNMSLSFHGSFDKNDSQGIGKTRQGF